MLEALCRSSGTTLDSVHVEDGPPITQRTSGLTESCSLTVTADRKLPDRGTTPFSETAKIAAHVWPSWIGSISDGSLFLTLPTHLVTGHIVMSSAG